MIKRTLFFSNPYHLSINLGQIIVTSKSTREDKTIPAEDIGYIVLENPQITFSQQFISTMSKYNVAVIFCDSQYMPTSMLFHLDTHTVQTERFKSQLSVSEPFKKNIWKQLIIAKVQNQAEVLNSQGFDSSGLRFLQNQVKSGDPDNIEGRAARKYWSRLFGSKFTRDRNGESPNHALNYGYTILRAATARAISGSGLLPTIGVFHRNKYNSFCLADDVMEPYRPFVDRIVISMYKENRLEAKKLVKEIKVELLGILTEDVLINGELRPLMNALTATTSSLAHSFSTGKAKLKLPNICDVE